MAIFALLAGAPALAAAESKAGIADGPTSDQSRRILTPPASPVPRINGAKVFGVRPGSPFLFKIAATGDRPLAYAADGLPAGLTLDPQTGVITGRLADPGTHRVVLRVSNARGQAGRELRIVVGEALALTPPMGWNSWYSWSESVTQENVAAAAQALVRTGLIDHGWTYVNIDDCWQGARGGRFGAIQPNEKFPDMAGLVKGIHAQGLKFGIYSTIWLSSYAGFIGGSAPAPDGDYASLPMLPPAERLQPAQVFGRFPSLFRLQLARPGPYMMTDRDARQYAAWGVDYIKYDWRNWTFLDPVGTDNPRREFFPKTEESVARVAAELRATGRDIVLGLSPISYLENRHMLPRHAQRWRI
ncbi:MAG: putative Ig domain-containing protein, partial [Opitutae bacterium]|nr:putative Ig domain-containing protein [Opitutae bacterium]